MAFWDFLKSSNDEKLPQISLPEEDRRWIEESFIYFGELFGFQKIQNQEIYHIDQFFGRGKEYSFDIVFNTICNVYELDGSNIIVRIFDDIEEMSWSTYSMAAGEYYHSFTDIKKEFNVELSKSTFEHPERLIGVLAHELAHVKLLGGNYMAQNEPNLEPLTDIFVIFSGFGIFTANIGAKYSNDHLVKIGYLTNEYIAYALALYSWILGREHTEMVDYLDTNTRYLYKDYLNYIKKTKDTLLTFEKIEFINSKYSLFSQVNMAVAENDYKTAVEKCDELLLHAGKDAYVYTNRGYAHMMLGDYEKAIADFNQSISIQPYYDSAFAHRGYCYIKLKRYENASVDLDTASHLNATNVIAQRNLGIYYMEIGELEKAESFLSTAFAMDPTVLWISYLLGDLFMIKGELEMAKEYYTKSAELGENEGMEALKRLF